MSNLQTIESPAANAEPQTTNDKPAAAAIEYDGKTLLTLPKSLHRKLAEAADSEGVDLNQYLVMLLSEQNALNAVGSVQQKLDELNQQIRVKEASIRQSDRLARQQRLAYDNRYIENLESGLND
ncbi:MAG: toxin-antitoxin system HicB family antitoxin [Phormidesmis sp.]